MRSALSWVDMLDFIVSISRHFLFNKSAVSVKEAVCLEGGTPASIYLQFLSLPSLPSISHWRMESRLGWMRYDCTIRWPAMTSWCLVLSHLFRCTCLAPPVHLMSLRWMFCWACLFPFPVWFLATPLWREIIPFVYLSCLNTRSSLFSLANEPLCLYFSGNQIRSIFNLVSCRCLVLRMSAACVPRVGTCCLNPFSTSS